MKRAAMQLVSAQTVPLAERGRMMSVRDIYERLEGRKSAWWIRTQFAQHYKRYLGRTPYWWECDVAKALDEMREGS